MAKGPISGSHPNPPQPIHGTDPRETSKPGPARVRPTEKVFVPPAPSAGNLSSPGPDAAQLFAQAGEGIDLKKALAEADPQEQRGFLIEALNHFVNAGDQEKAGEVISLLELSLPMMETLNSEFLQLYTLIYQSLKGTGFPQEEEIKAKGEGLAKGLVEPNAPLGARVREAVLAREFFQLSENPEEFGRHSRILRGFREEIRKELEVKGRLKPGERRELAGLAVQIDQRLLPEYLEEVTSSDYEGPTLGERILPGIRRLREESLGVKGISLEKQIADGALLAQALIPLQNLLSGENPQVNSEAWDAEKKQLQSAMEKVLAEAMTQESQAGEAQKQLAGALVQDLQYRFNEALDRSEMPYFQALNGEGILAFAKKSQEAHLKLKQLQDPSTSPSVEAYLSVATLFAGLGLKGRVRETLEPLEKLAPSLEPPEIRALLYMQLGQAYQISGMAWQSNQAFQEIIRLNNNFENPRLNALSQRAYLFGLLNGRSLAEAEGYIKGLPATPENQSLLGKLQQGLRSYRWEGGIQILGAALADYTRSWHREEPEKRALMQESIQGVLAKTRQLISTGEAGNFSQAFRKAMQGSAYATPLGNFALETKEGAGVFGLLDQLSDPDWDDQDLINESLKLGMFLSGRNYFQGVAAIGNFVESHPRAGEEEIEIAREMREGIPSAALFNSAMFALQELVAMTSVAGNVLNPNIKMDKGFFIRAGLTVGTLGIARGVGVGAQALWVARMEKMIASPVAFRLSTLGVRSAAEAAAFPIAGMGFRSLMSGEPSHWSLRHFGKEFASTLAMFALLNASSMGLAWGGTGTGEAVKAAKRALEKAKAAGDDLALAQRRLAGARLADSVVKSGATAWGTRVGAFTGSGYVNQFLGLSDDEKGASLSSRLIRSAVTDKQMRVGGKVVDAVSGGRLSKLERGTAMRLEQHFIKSQMLQGMGSENPLRAFIEEMFEQGEAIVTPEGLVFKMVGKGLPGEVEVHPRVAGDGIVSKHPVEDTPSTPRDGTEEGLPGQERPSEVRLVGTRGLGAVEGLAKAGDVTAQRDLQQRVFDFDRAAIDFIKELAQEGWAWAIECLRRGAVVHRDLQPVFREALKNYAFEAKGPRDTHREGYLILEGFATPAEAKGEHLTVINWDGEGEKLWVSSERSEEIRPLVGYGLDQGRPPAFRPGDRLVMVKTVRGEGAAGKKAVAGKRRRAARGISAQKLIESMASELHDAWRAPRRKPDGTYEPRIKPTQDRAWIAKHGGRAEVDIANTSYGDLPADWKGENLASALVSMGKVLETAKRGDAPGNSLIGEDFLEEASSQVHEKWLERQGAWAQPQQKLSYEKLSEAEKEKDRDFVRHALEIHERMRVTKILDRRFGAAKRDYVLTYLEKNHASAQQVAILRRFLDGRLGDTHDPVDLVHYVVREVPPDAGFEEKGAAQLAFDRVREAREAGRELDGAFIEETGARIHRESLQKKIDAGEKFHVNPMQWRPYERLYEWEKERVRNFIKGAIQDHELMSISESLEQRFADDKRDYVLNYLWEKEASYHQIATLRRFLEGRLGDTEDPVDLVHHVIQNVPREPKGQSHPREMVEDPRDFGGGFAFGAVQARNEKIRAEDLAAAKNFYNELSARRGFDFLIGEGGALGIIVPSPGAQSTWRIKRISRDRKRLVLQNVQDPSATTTATALKEHFLKKGDGVEIAGGGGGRALGRFGESHGESNSNDSVAGPGFEPQSRGYFKNRDLAKYRAMAGGTVLGDPVINIHKRLNLGVPGAPVRILDLGAGEGLAGGELKNLFGKNVRIETNDIENNDLVAKLRSDEHHEGDFLDIDFGENKYDLIFSVYGPHAHNQGPHGENRLETMLDRAIELLAPGGEFFSTLTGASTKDSGLIFTDLLTDVTFIEKALERGVAITLQRVGAFEGDLLYIKRLGENKPPPIRTLLETPVTPIFEGIHPREIAAKLKGFILEAGGTSQNIELNPPWMEDNTLRVIGQNIQTMGVREYMENPGLLLQGFYKSFFKNFQERQGRVPTGEEIKTWLNGENTEPGFSNLPILSTPYPIQDILQAKLEGFLPSEALESNGHYAG